MSHRNVDRVMYRGKLLTVIGIRPAARGDVIPLLCEDLSEVREYERLFGQRPPYVLDASTPLGRPCRQHREVLIELLEAPALGWPWLAAFYSPMPYFEWQRGHWSFELAGDFDEAYTIALKWIAFQSGGSAGK
jgi:hypothetical protein